MTRFLLMLVMAFYTMSLLIFPASAQSNRTNEYGGGSRLQPRAAQIVQSGPDAAASVLRDFGECIVSRRVLSTEQLVGLPIDTPAYEKGMRRLFATVDDACLGGDGSLQFSNSLLRGALFEALYRRKFADGGIGQFPADFETALDRGYSQPRSDQVRQHLTLQQFSECVTKQQAGEVRKLVLSSPGSSAEQAAITALAPSFGPCFGSGASLKMTKPALRAMLAESVYRMSVFAKSTGMSK